MVAPVIPASTQTQAVYGPPQGQWTVRDWESLPDDGNRYEIIDGVLYVSTAPSSFHQWITLRMYRNIGIPAEDQKLAFTFLAPIGVFMPGCEPVQPDFVLVLTENAHIFQDRRIHGIPDLIIEVMSPGSRDYDEGVKLSAYAKGGVPEYGVIDPASRQLRLYSLQDGEYGEGKTYDEGDTLTFACLPTIPVSISALFEGAPDTTL